MRIATAFWTTLLGASLLAIGVGFLGGSSYGTSLRPRPPAPQLQPVPPAPSVAAYTRTLHGANGVSFAGDVDPDPFGDVDDAVAERPAGWAPRPAPSAAPRIAVIVVDADREATALVPFMGEPFPLAVLIPPDYETDTLRIAQDGGKTALIDCAGTDPQTVRDLREDGAAGIMCSVDDPARAAALVAANGRGVVVDDLLGEGDDLYRAARRARRRALTRDVTADAREDPAYVGFMLDQSLAVARRTGVAVVAIHARDGSRLALERFAARAQRDGIRLVDVTRL